MPEDKWGIPFFYPTKDTAGVSEEGNGFFWQQNNDIHKDDDYEGNGFLRIGKEHDSSNFKNINTTTGEWQFPFTYDYDYSPTLSLSGPTGHHSGGVTHGCQGFTYMIQGEFDTTPPKFRFRKETYHVQYNDHPEGRWTSPFATGTVTNNWKGIGWVRYNKKDGRGPGKDSVICEVWWNEDPVADITNWKMLKRIEDKGEGATNWGVPATCDGEAYQVGTWSNIQFRIKSSGADFSLHPLIPEFDSGSNIHSIGKEDMSFSDSERRGYGKRADMPRDIEMKCLFKWNGGGSNGLCRFKNLSLREIDPTKSFDDTPENPPPGEGPTNTQTIQGNFKLLWDLNTSRVSTCAGTNLVLFYSWPADNDKIIGATEGTTRVTQQQLNSSSPMNGKIIKQLDVPLKKTGSPSATPTIAAKIWSSGGSVVYTSPTTIDPTTLTTSFVNKVFDFSTNTRVFVTGDRVGIEYTGGTLNNYTDFVTCGYRSGFPGNDDYSQYASSVWSNKTDRDFACDMWT